MATVRVPQKDGEVVVYDGDRSHAYRVKDGAIVVNDSHLAAVLASVPGSEHKPEAPAKEAP